MAFKPFKAIGEGFKYLKRGVVAFGPALLGLLATVTKNKKLTWVSNLLNTFLANLNRPKTKGTTPMATVDTEIKQIVNAIIKAQGASPEQLVFTTAEVLGSVGNLLAEFKGKSQEEIFELIDAGIDGCIGSEGDALIGGAGSGALVEVQFLNGEELEGGSDLAKKLIKEALKKKLA